MLLVFLHTFIELTLHELNINVNHRLYCDQDVWTLNHMLSPKNPGLCVLRKRRQNFYTEAAIQKLEPLKKDKLIHSIFSKTYFTQLFCLFFVNLLWLVNRFIYNTHTHKHTHTQTHTHTHTNRGG